MKPRQDAVETHLAALVRTLQGGAENCAFAEAPMHGFDRLQSLGMAIPGLICRLIAGGRYLFFPYQLTADHRQLTTVYEHDVEACGDSRRRNRSRSNKRVLEDFECNCVAGRFQIRDDAFRLGLRTLFENRRNAS